MAEALDGDGSGGWELTGMSTLAPGLCLDAGNLGVAKPAPRSYQSCTGDVHLRRRTAVTVRGATQSEWKKEKRSGRSRTLPGT
jgi:hypothetical protein